jgi:hypothetical protein
MWVANRDAGPLQLQSRKTVSSNRSEATAEVDAALMALARLLARQAAREDHAASLNEQEASDGKDLA